MGLIHLPYRWWPGRVCGHGRAPGASGRTRPPRRGLLAASARRQLRRKWSGFRGSESGGTSRWGRGQLASPLHGGGTRKGGGRPPTPGKDLLKTAPTRSSACTRPLLGDGRHSGPGGSWGVPLRKAEGGGREGAALSTPAPHQPKPSAPDADHWTCDPGPSHRPPWPTCQTVSSSSWRPPARGPATAPGRFSETAAGADMAEEALTFVLTSGGCRAGVVRWCVDSTHVAAVSTGSDDSQCSSCYSGTFLWHKTWRKILTARQ